MLRNDKTVIYDLVTTAGPAGYVLTINYCLKEGGLLRSEWSDREEAPGTKEAGADVPVQL